LICLLWWWSWGLCLLISKFFLSACENENLQKQTRNQILLFSPQVVVGNETLNSFDKYCGVLLGILWEIANGLLIRHLHMDLGEDFIKQVWNSTTEKLLNVKFVKCCSLTQECSLNVYQRGAEFNNWKLALNVMFYVSFEAWVFSHSSPKMLIRSGSTRFNCLGVLC
jgi:hypothetical protein